MLDLTCEKFANFSLSFGCPKKPVYSVENWAPYSSADSQDAEVQNPGTHLPKTVL